MCRRSSKHKVKAKVKINLNYNNSKTETKLQVQPQQRVQVHGRVSYMSSMKVIIILVARGGLAVHNSDSYAYACEFEPHLHAWGTVRRPTGPLASFFTLSLFVLSGQNV